MSTYETDSPKWTTVLDVDELSKTESIPWVWRGTRALPRARDPFSEDGKIVTRVMISLSKDGEEAVVVREFDLLTGTFVVDDAFSLPDPAKTRVSYKSRDVLLVGSDFGPGSMTNAGFPKTIREWNRGQDIKNAKVVFEGEQTDVAVTSYIDDERPRGGSLYEIRTRIISTNATNFFVRKLKPEQLLQHDDPKRQKVGEPPDFKELHIPESSEIDFVGNLLVIILRSDWSPEDGTIFVAGSLIYVNSHKFVKYGPKDRIYHVLFEPKEFMSCEDYIVTKDFVVLCVSDTLSSRLEFYKLEKDANKLRLVGLDKKPQMRTMSIRAVDAYDGNMFWLTTCGYTEQITLSLADAANMDTDDKKVIRRTGSEGYILRKLKSLPTCFDASTVEVSQKLATSKDGTKVPYFIISNKNSQSKEKRSPTLLYAYGAFGVSLGPQYAGATGIAWIERGGVYVEAIVRGGGEFGDDWHQAGSREKANSSVEDLVAVAEDLVATKVCSPKTLALRGGSAGAVTVSNAYLSRPDLFGAVHCACPLLDLKRLHSMPCPRNWLDEFGDPDTDHWNEFMKRVSPLQVVDDNVKKYPPALFTTAEQGAIMHPGHARKMVKKLWDKGMGKKWPAFYFETPASATVEEQYAFATSLAYEFLFKKVTKSKK
jgi:prolyl oligopeptidase